MNVQRFLLACLAAVITFSGCDFVGGGGGGTGGGTGTVTFTFNKGFTFVRKDDRNVYIADNADLQTTAVLTNSGGVLNPSLSANGARIVYVRKEGTVTALSTVLVGGSTPTTVLTSDTTKRNFRQPVFSPDGTKIVFGFDESTSSSIGLVNSDGSGFTKVIGGSSLAYNLPSFTPDGKAIIAAAGNSGLQLTSIERIDLTSGVNTTVSNNLRNDIVNIANRLVVSPDGTKAAFDGAVSTGVTRVYFIDLTSKVVTQVNRYMGEPNTNDSYPTWYTNSAIAFGSDSGGNDNIYTASLTGNGDDRKLVMGKAIEAWFGPVSQ